MNEKENREKTSVSSDGVEAAESKPEPDDSKPTGGSLTHQLGLRKWEMNNTNWKIWAKDALELTERQAEECKEYHAKLTEASTDYLKLYQEVKEIWKHLESQAEQLAGAKKTITNKDVIIDRLNRRLDDIGGQC